MKKIKELFASFVTFLKKVKGFFTGLSPVLSKIVKFLKKWGTHIINLFILCVAYATVDIDTWAGIVIGLWLFFLIAYYLFWEIFNASGLFKKDEDQA